MNLTPQFRNFTRKQIETLEKILGTAMDSRGLLNPVKFEVHHHPDPNRFHVPPFYVEIPPIIAVPLEEPYTGNPREGLKRAADAMIQQHGKEATIKYLASMLWPASKATE